MSSHPMEQAWDEEYWQVVLEQGEAPSSESWAQDAYRAAWERNGGWEAGEEDAADEDGARSPRYQAWREARQLLEQGGTLQLPVTGYNRGGLLVQWNQLQGFVPASHLVGMPRVADMDVRSAYLTQRIGDTLALRVIEIDEVRDRLVLSERDALFAAATSDPFERLNAGAQAKGRVSTVCDFGAFVDLGSIEGLIHISELSWGRVRQPADIVKVGQEVDVLILSLDPKTRKIALSLKQLQPDPWVRVGNLYIIGQHVRGKVTNVVSFGAFVEIEEGIEGLVHISELAEGSFMHPRNVVKEGQDVLARVIAIDVEHHRLGLSLRQSAQDELAG